MTVEGNQNSVYLEPVDELVFPEEVGAEPSPKLAPAAPPREEGKEEDNAAAKEAIDTIDSIAADVDMADATE